METKPVNAEDPGNGKSEVNSEDKAEMLQHEKLIDPGNEHSHHVEHELKREENQEARFDAEASDANTEPGTKKE